MANQVNGKVFDWTDTAITLPHGQLILVKDISYKGGLELEEVYDKGGPTAFGITIPTLKFAHASGVVKHADICKLTRDEAEAIYRRNFWERYGWGELRWPASLCCLDVSINHGGFAWILQRACVDCGARIAVDGKFAALRCWPPNPKLWPRPS